MQHWGKKGPSEASGSGGEQHAAKRRGVGATDEQTQKIITLLVKTGLKNLQDVRELQAAVFKVVHVRADDPLIKAALAATKDYTEQARAAGRGHGLGEPHVWVWRALVTTATPEGADKQIVEEHCAASSDPVQLSKLILGCCLHKAFDKGFMKVFLSVHSSLEPVMNIIIKDLEKRGGQLKLGLAPKGGMERELQEALDAMEV